MVDSDSPNMYETLKMKFGGRVPFKMIANFSTRLILSENLDSKQPLRCKNGYPRDYRGLGELMEFQYSQIRTFERQESPTQAILHAWENTPDATVEKLIEYLEEMDRHDVIQEIVSSLERDAKIYLKNESQNSTLQDSAVSSCCESMNPENMKMMTLDDLKTGECTHYDAFVCYADEDFHFVVELAKYLESSAIKFKLFIRDRSMLAGFVEHDITLKLIKERCRRMLLILSPNFLKSYSCEFQASFAAGLAIEERKRILIPLVIAPCKEDDIPLVFKQLNRVDFTRLDIYAWSWEILIKSIQRTDLKLTYNTPENLPIQPYINHIYQPEGLTD